MDILTAIQANLLSPAVLFFVLGLIAALTKSDLKFPEPLYIGLTIYLLIAIGFKGGLIAIGFKGGVAIAEAGLAKVWLPAFAAMGLGALIPLWTYPVLRFGGKLPGVDAAAIAAHYGSVSAVTFIAATNYLKAIEQPFENYATAFLAVMEAPAILVGVVLGKNGPEEDRRIIKRLAAHRRPRGAIRPQHLPFSWRARGGIPVRRARDAKGGSFLCHPVSGRARAFPPGDGCRRRTITLGIPIYF